MQIARTAPALDRDEVNDRMQRMTGMFSRALSVLAGRKVFCEVRNSPNGAPAWSSVNTVYLNRATLPDVLGVDEVLSIKGLAHHERAHIEYTPRNGSALVKWVIDNGFFRAFNALEDQRIETLMVGRYPSLVPWLTATVALFLMKDPDKIVAAYPLLRGRRYLPVEVRRLAKDSYLRQQDIPEIQKVVDEYRTLLFPQDADRAKPLIETFDRLMRDLLRDMPEPQDGSRKSIPDPNGHDHRPQEGVESSDVRPRPKKEQERDRERGLRQDRQDENDAPEGDDAPQDGTEGEPQDAQDDGQEGQGQGSEGQDDSQDGDEGQGSESGSEASDEGSESGAEGDVQQDAEGEGAGRSGASSETGLDRESIEQVLENAVDDAYDKVSHEVEDLVRRINGDDTLRGNNAKEPIKASSHDVDVPAEAGLLARRFAVELERISADNDPAWHRGVESGRLNPLRFKRGDEIDTVFDRWEEGRADATDIECVIMLDTSGSMLDQARLANSQVAAWAMKRGLDKIAASTTVLTFASEGVTRVLYSSKEKATTKMRSTYAGGGTYANDAIIYATRVLAESDRAIKILIAVTDGEWGWDGSKDIEEVHGLIRRLNKGGVVTALARISADNVDRYNFATVVDVNSPADVLPFAQKIVRTAIRNRLAHH